MIIKRDEKLAVIHIARKQCGLDDACYRELLRSCAGVESSADLKTEAQFSAVMEAFNRLGFISARTKASRMLDAVRARAYTILGPGYEKRLAGYLAKMGRSSLAGCKFQELRRIMAFLSTIERKAKQAKEAS